MKENFPNGTQMAKKLTDGCYDPHLLYPKSQKHFAYFNRNQTAFIEEINISMYLLGSMDTTLITGIVGPRGMNLLLFSCIPFFFLSFMQRIFSYLGMHFLFIYMILIGRQNGMSFYHISRTALYKETEEF